MGLVASLRTIPNAGYLAQVFHYLTSALGADCSEEIALRLAELPDPETLGLSLRPTLAQLHRARRCLERIAAHEAAHEATAAALADDPLDRLLRQLRELRIPANE